MTDSDPFAADHAAREDVSFTVGGDRLVGWFYRAAGHGASAPAGPAIVLGHGLGGIKEMGLERYCAVFSRAGYHALAFDYRRFGGSGGHPRQVVDMDLQRADWHGAIAYARARPEIDAERIALFGSSFGGGHALVVAADDPRVKAVVAQCPFTHGLRSALATGPLVAPVLLFHALRDLLFGAADGDANSKVHLVPLVAKTGGVALINSHDAWDGYFSLIPEGQAFTNGIGGRLLPRLLLAYPGRAGARAAAHAPVFWGICGRDICAPAGPTEGYARAAQAVNDRGVVRVFPDMGHFDIYTGARFDKATGEYTRWLQSVLPVQQPRL